MIKNCLLIFFLTSISFVACAKKESREEYFIKYPANLALSLLRCKYDCKECDCTKLSELHKDVNEAISLFYSSPQALGMDIIKLEEKIALMSKAKSKNPDDSLARLNRKLSRYKTVLNVYDSEK